MRTVQDLTQELRQLLPLLTTDERYEVQQLAQTHSLTLARLTREHSLLELETWQKHFTKEYTLTEPELQAAATPFRKALLLTRLTFYASALKLR